MTTLDSTKQCVWYIKDPGEINKPIRGVLENYSGIPSRDIVSHVQTVVCGGIKYEES